MFSPSAHQPVALEIVKRTYQACSIPEAELFAEHAVAKALKDLPPAEVVLQMASFINELLVPAEMFGVLNRNQLLQRACLQAINEGLQDVTLAALGVVSQYALGDQADSKWLPDTIAVVDGYLEDFDAAEMMVIMTSIATGILVGMDLSGLTSGWEILRHAEEYMNTAPGD